MADPQAAGQGKEDDSIKVICRSLVTSLYLEKLAVGQITFNTSLKNTLRKS